MFRTSSVHHQERFVQAVFADLVCGNTRTTRHVQLLLWYVVIRVLLDTSSRYFVTTDDTRSLQYQVCVSCWTAYIYGANYVTKCMSLVVNGYRCRKDLGVSSTFELPSKIHSKIHN